MESVASAPIPNFIFFPISLKILYLSRFFDSPVFLIHLLYTFSTPFYTVAVGELSSNKDTAFNIESFVTCTYRSMVV